MKRFFAQIMLTVGLLVGLASTNVLSMPIAEKQVLLSNSNEHPQCQSSSNSNACPGIYAPFADILAKLEKDPCCYDALLADALAKRKKDPSYGYLDSSQYKIGDFLEEHALLIGILLAVIGGCGYGTKLYRQRQREYSERIPIPRCGQCAGCKSNIGRKTGLWSICEAQGNPKFQMERDFKHDLICILKVIVSCIVITAIGTGTSSALGKLLKLHAEQEHFKKIRKTGQSNCRTAMRQLGEVGYKPTCDKSRQD